jgi:hypothetical protein
MMGVGISTVRRGSELLSPDNRYGIANIDLSHVELGEGTAVIFPERLEIANSDRHVSVNCAERLQRVRLLWERREVLPPGIAALLAQHAQETVRETPLGPGAKAIVANLQRAAAAHARTLGLPGHENADAVPFLLSLVEGPGRSPSVRSASTDAIPPAPDQAPPQFPEPPQAPSPAQQDQPGDQPQPTPLQASRETSEGDAYAAVSPPPEDSIEETGEEALEPAAPLVAPQSKPPTAPQPRRYQPQARGIATGKRSAGTGTPRQEPVERSCPIEVRLRNRAGGAFTLSLLPRRRNGMPEEVEVFGAGESPLTLSALHEAWYQDVIPADLGSALRKGVAWYADRPECRLQWMLSGRDLYVLGPRDELSGYVSTPRLVLGDKHAVLCTVELREQVLALVQECCGTTPASIDPEDGLPAGWIGFRGVCPIRSIPLSPSPEILDALRPALDVQIHLRGGIRLQYSQWLIGFPPAIRLVGAAADAQPAVSIDHDAAVQAPDGTFTAPGWDQPGEHLVACEALTRSYSLIAPPDSWEAWSAHCQSGNLNICGAAVGMISPAAVRPSVVVPAANPLLLGHNIDRHYRCNVHL